MKGIRLLVWAGAIAAALGAGAASAGADMPPAPNVSFVEGAALVSLVRSAMTGYLRHRTPADKQVVPPALQALLAKPYGVAVLLRDKGQLVAREIEIEGDLPRNVIAAALRAMRSSRLPDHVTQAHLDSLTVEVEVLGGPRPIRERDLADSLGPGAIGLLASRGHRTVHVLPSTVVLESLQPLTMRRACLTGLGLQRGDLAQPLQWAVFTSRHFVGYADGRVVQLWRGKRPLPRQAVDEPTLAAEAERVALYLASHQDPHGLYQAGRLADEPRETPASAPAAPPPSADHLYATWVLSRLVHRATPAAQKVLHASLARAVQATLAHVRTDPKAHTAYVAAALDEDQFEATAWLAMILAERRVAPATRPATMPAGISVATLQKALLGAVTEKGHLRAVLAPAPPGRAAMPSLRAAVIGYLALQRTRKLAAVPPARADALARAVVNRALLSSGQIDVLTALWWSRSGLKLTSGRTGAPLTATFFPDPMPISLARKPLPDELGGFATPGGEPTTPITALTVLKMRRRLAHEKLTPDERAALQQETLEARRFCYLMAFQPYEAYFAAEPARWVGAVRHAPATAEVTLGACAAAIEALSPAQ